MDIDVVEQQRNRSFRNARGVPFVIEVYCLFYSPGGKFFGVRENFTRTVNANRTNNRAETNMLILCSPPWMNWISFFEDIGKCSIRIKITGFLFRTTGMQEPCDALKTRWRLQIGTSCHSTTLASPAFLFFELVRYGVSHVNFWRAVSNVRSWLSISLYDSGTGFRNARDVPLVQTGRRHGLVHTIHARSIAFV